MTLPAATQVRVVLPAHLRALAGISGEVRLDVPVAPTVRSVLDELEARYPVLCGTIRDRGSGQRRAFIRFFGAELDLSLDPPDTRLPASVASGTEPFLVVGAVAGG